MNACFFLLSIFRMQFLFFYFFHCAPVILTGKGLQRNSVSYENERIVVLRYLKWIFIFIYEVGGYPSACRFAVKRLCFGKAF